MSAHTIRLEFAVIGSFSAQCAWSLSYLKFPYKTYTRRIEQESNVNFYSNILLRYIEYIACDFGIISEFIKSRHKQIKISPQKQKKNA